MNYLDKIISGPIPKLLLIWLVMTLVCNVTSAQEFLYNTIDISDGLPSNEAYRVYQTSDGFYWLLTNGGLVRYDGKEMKVFDLSNGLPSDDVFKVHEDECGRLWVMSQSSDLCFIKNGEIKVLKSSSKPRPYIYWSDEQGAKFFNFEIAFGISCDTDSLVEIKSLSFNKKTLPISDSLSIVLDEKFPSYPKIDILLRKNIVASLDSSGQIFGSFSSGLIHGSGIILVPGSEDFKGQFYYVIDVQNRTIEARNLEPYTSSLIFSFNRQEKEFNFHRGDQVLVYDSLLSEVGKYGVPVQYQGEVKFTVKDRHEGQWVTSDKGIAYFSNMKRRINFQLEESFGDRNIIKLEVANDVLIGAELNGDIYSQSKSRKGKDELFGNLNSKRGRIYDMIFAYNSLYVSTKNAYLEQWDANGYTLNSQEDSWYTDYRYEEPRKRRARCKKFAKGNSCFCGMSEEPFQFTSELDVLFVRNGRSLCTDVEYDSSNKMFWLSEPDCIIGFHECENKTDTIVSIAGVREMFVLPDGMLLNTNDKKIYRCIDTDCIEVENVKLKIQSVVSANRTIYLATTDDIYKFDLKSNELKKVFNAYNSLSSQSINDLAYKAGKLYVATTEGVFSCYSDSLMVYNQDMAAVITSPDVDTTIQIDYVDNSLAIDYTCITLENHDNLHFEYILRPVQNKPTTTQLRSINFAELAAHNYTFEVTAVNELGDRSNTAILKFEVKSPWFMTWWFYSLLALGALLLLYTLFLFYKRRLDKKAALDQKFAELELNALQSQMNPHFVFNTLNSIQNLIGANRNIDADRYLSKFARLMRKFLEVSKSKFITLDEELAITKEYLELEQLRFGEKLSYKLSIADELQNLDIMVPATLVQPFVENALIHGLFHKKGNGMVTVMAKNIDGDLIISIVDDGIGLEAANEKKKKRKIGHVSRGKELITQRLEVLKKLQNYDVKISMNDLKEVGSVGTRVEIIIPNFRDNYTTV